MGETFSKPIKQGAAAPAIQPKTRLKRITRKAAHAERNEKILRDYNKGMTIPELVEKYDLKRRRVHQILAEFPAE